VSRLRLATRGSPLALAQSRGVADQLEKALAVGVDLVPLTTSGDRIQAASLAGLGGKGLFVKEVEEALLDGRADLAVHSAKDLPAALAPGLVLAACPERADPRDALVSRVRGRGLSELPRGARVGTGSVRRRSQLLAFRPDLVVEPLRGNVDTRLRKLESEGLDAVILACAGLERLGLAARIDERIDAGMLLPAVGQGALAIEARTGGSVARDLAAIDHAPTHLAVLAERAFLARLSGDCTTPLAALATLEVEGRIRLRGLLASSDGSRVVRGEDEEVSARAPDLGRRVAEQVLAEGGAELLAALRAEVTP
jgi:hydroxymethylbilane synthase